MSLTGKAGKAIYNAGASTLEHASKMLALPTAAATVAGEGNYLERALSGPLLVGKGIYQQVSDFMNENLIYAEGKAREFEILGDALQNGADNLLNRPLETAAIALATGAAMYVLPSIARSVRKRQNNNAKIEAGVNNRLKRAGLEHLIE